MKFPGLLAIRELKRNKFKLALATVISFILFMSAFLLVNLATALPENFYTYYEENYRQDMTIEISDADVELLDNADKYFDEFELDYKYINEKFYLNANGEQFAFMQSDTVGGGEIVKYYKGDYATVGEVPPKVKKLINAGFVKDGTMWETSNNFDSVFIADIVADRLGLRAGHTISIVLEVPDKVSGGTIKLNNMHVQGVYDYAMATQNGQSFPVFYMRADRAQVLYLETYEKYRVTGKVKDISNFYSVYSDLSKSYSLSENTIIDMIGTVKNAEVICYIIGITMLIGGMIVLMNFITMLISSNRQNIGIMLGLGAKYRQIASGYSCIFAGMIALVTLLSLCLLPTVNALITVFCLAAGYNFVIGTHYLMLLALYACCNTAMVIIMWVDKIIMSKTTPTCVLQEED